jgi:hypothetical protein
MIRPTLTRILALATLLVSGTALARQAELVEMRLRDLDTGRELPVYWHEGRAHVPGRPGNRYAVVLENRSAERVLAVLSVDGVNAVTGQTADPAQSGYVLGPYQRTEIRGWRKDLSSIAEFVFTDLGDSYAARTGRPRNVGVIGVAVFQEKRLPPRRPPVAIAKEAAPASPALRDADGASKSARGAAQELGTGHGERRYDPVGRTEFVRASRQPAQVTSLFYDDERALVDRGIIPRGRHDHRRRPDPFPIGFVPDPPRWR